MSKKYNSVSMVFLKTLIFTTVLLLGTVFILSFFIGKSDEKDAEKIVYEIGKAEEIPDNSLSMTTLIIFGNNGEKSGTNFILTRFLSDKEKLYILPLPASMMCQSGTEKLSVYEFFRKYGEKKATKVVSETLNIPIEKYIYLDNTGFATTIDNISGKTEYDIPLRIEYYSETLSEYVFIENGNKKLSGNEIRQYLSCPSFSDKFRSEQGAFLISRAVLSENGDYISFLENINLYDDFISHNFSYDEFLSRAELIKKIKKNNKNFTVVIFPSGEWKDGYFFPSVDFKNYLSEKFVVRRLVEISDGY